MTETRKIDRKEDWLYACAVVAHGRFSGLGGMLVSCYIYEKMMIEVYEKMITEELMDGRSFLTLPPRYKYYALYRAWICVFFEALRVMCSKKYIESTAPCIKERINEIKEIKKVISRVRLNISKLEEQYSNSEKELKEQEEKGNLEIKRFVKDYHVIEISRNVVLAKKGRQKMWRSINKTEIDTYDESNKFLSILKNCDVPEYGKHWLSKTVI